MQRLLTSLIPRTYGARFVVAMALYGGLFYLSTFLVPEGGSGASLVFPPAALGVALLFFWGYDLWPALILAGLCALLAREAAPPLAAISAVANTLEALLGAYILHRFVGFDPMMRRLRDSLGLVLMAIASSLISATIITVGIFIINQTPVPSSALWLGIWVGHVTSLISIAPFFFYWVHRPHIKKTFNEIIEGVVGFGSLAIVCVLVFWTPYGAIAGISLFYAIIIILIWSSLRTGPRGTSLALFLLATIGATGVIFGYGPMSLSTNVSQTLFGVQLAIGMFSLIFLLFTSITEERKDAVLELQGHVGQLEGALQKISSEDKAKADFIAILAHELRNPLSPILSGLELLKARDQGDPAVLTMMSAHLNTIARLLDDLLDISRISQKKFKLQKEPVEIRAVVGRAIEMVKPLVESRNHKLSIDLSQGEVWVHGDPVRITQILVNLLTNAAKYTEAGGEIKLFVQRTDQDLLVRVSDSGIGISADRLETIFEPFGTESEPQYQSSGLHIGLSLAQRMTHMHHGTLEVKSDGVGKGSEFVVRLPLPPTAPLPMEVPRMSVRSRFSKKIFGISAERGSLPILVVDDNRPAAQTLAALLRDNGHDVTVAFDAPEALAEAAAHPPRVALLDIGLPSMNGYELGKLLRQRAKEDIMLIAISGYGQEDDREKARDAGFDEHLVKPVSIADVERVINELRG